MAGYDIPQDLIDLQKAFWAADNHAAQLVAGLPLGVDIAAGEAEIPDETRKLVDEARRERSRLVAELYGHPWFETVNRVEPAHEALREAAKAGLPPVADGPI